MVEKFGDSRLAIVFKISIVELIDIYQKMINITLPLNFIKGWLKMIWKICEENACEFQ